MCRAILGNPALSDVEAERLLEQLYSFADVTVDAFIEQQGRSKAAVEAAEVPVVAILNDPLTSPSAA